jgi:hypothetical protein
MVRLGLVNEIARRAADEFLWASRVLAKGEVSTLL